VTMAKRKQNKLMAIVILLILLNAVAFGILLYLTSTNLKAMEHRFNSELISLSDSIIEAFQLEREATNQQLATIQNESLENDRLLSSLIEQRSEELGLISEKQ